MQLGWTFAERVVSYLILLSGKMAGSVLGCVVFMLGFCPLSWHFHAQVAWSNKLVLIIVWLCCQRPADLPVPC